MTIDKIINESIDRTMMIDKVGDAMSDAIWKRVRDCVSQTIREQILGDLGLDQSIPYNTTVAQWDVLNKVIGNATPE